MLESTYAAHRTPRGPSSSDAARHDGFRPDIQAVRAIAVVAVLLYHLWPKRLPGGFIGVDVFFVVSGFLITAHIVRGLRRASPGRFLIDFYARRIRRLAPAAVTVLVAVLLGTLLLKPIGAWQAGLQNILASTFFVENWHLANESVDYLAADAAPSAVQHYWSLSVEEQFYILWPLLFVVLLGMRFTRRGQITAVSVTLGASLVFAVIATVVTPEAAYFLTPARAWQLAAGALISFITLSPGRARAALPWCGTALIVVGAFTITGATPYPGIAAIIPTLGACLILLGGPNAAGGAFDRVARAKPVQFIGDISYSLYLWHWPLIVFVPLVLGHNLKWPEKLGILGASIVLAWLSYRYIERPFRSRRFSTRPTRSFIAGTMALLIVVIPSATAVAYAESQIQTSVTAMHAAKAAADRCASAGSMLASCEDDHTITASIAAAAAEDKPRPWLDKCINGLGDASTVLCQYGDPDAEDEVLLWGDSHAAAWAPALDEAGKSGGFRAVIATRHGCPSTLTAPIATVGRDIAPSEREACAERNEWVARAVLPDADLVVLANMTTNYEFDVDLSVAFGDSILAARDVGVPVAVLEDVPLTGDDEGHRVNGPECLASGEACSNARARALNDRLDTALTDAGIDDEYTLVRTHDAFCSAEACYFASGDTSVYFDASHLSDTYSASLGPWLAESLDDLVTR